MKTRDLNPIINKTKLAEALGMDYKAFSNLTFPREYESNIIELEQLLKGWIKKTKEMKQKPNNLKVYERKTKQKPLEYYCPQITRDRYQIEYENEWKYIFKQRFKEKALKSLGARVEGNQLIIPSKA